MCVLISTNFYIALEQTALLCQHKVNFVKVRPWASMGLAK